MSLARNTALNLAGQVLPLMVAIVAFPALWEALGREMFGMLLLIWSIIGYFSLFDLGLGRGLTRIVAQVVKQDSRFTLCDVVSAGLAVMVAIGVLGALLAVNLVPWAAPILVQEDAIAPERVVVLLTLTSYAIPLTIVGLCFRASLEGLQRFDMTAAVRLSFAVFLLGSPYVVVRAGGELEQVVLTLLAGILAVAAAYGVLLLRAMRPFRPCSSGGNRKEILGSLARYSGWVSVSNLTAPLLYYVDRFMISALLGVGVMSYYATPYEVITKALVGASAVSGAFFPLLAGFPKEQIANAVPLVRSGSKLNYLLTMPVALVCCIWAESLLTLWMGAEVAEQGSRILQILACGVLLNAAAYMPFTFLQAVGRPDLTARLHMIELPVYVVVLSFVIPRVGIVGAAWVWAARALIELVVFAIMTARITGVPQARSDLASFIGCTAVLVGISFSDLLPDARLRAALVPAASTLLLVFCWQGLLEKAERDRLLGLVMRHRG